MFHGRRCSKYDKIKRIFINPEIVEEYGDDWAFEEGCLSIPGVREDVFRAEEPSFIYL